MGKFLSNFYLFALILSCSGCLIKEEPKATYSELLVTRGDIVVASFTSDSLVVFGPDGTFKRVLYQLPNTVGDTITGITWLEETNEILIAVDGTPDRVDALSVLTGISRNFYNNTTYLTGTPLLIAQLKTSSDVIVSEGATIERFSYNGIRETWTTIWPTNVHANAQQLVALTNGNFLSCSSTAGLRITPDSTTVLTAVATASSAIVATTASYGCGALSDGTIVVAWNGTSDAIQTYSSTLTGATTIVSNAVVFGDPRGIAIGEGDEIYVADAARNMIVEIDSTGNIIREFGNSYLQSPRAIMVVPAFN
jgi:hypothetical protein